MASLVPFDGVKVNVTAVPGAGQPARAVFKLDKAKAETRMAARERRDLGGEGGEG